MSSPFSLEILRKAARRLSSYERIPSRHRCSSDEEETTIDHGNDSFRAFSTPREILSLSHVEGEESLPLLEASRLRAGAGLGLTTISGILFALASLFVKLSNSTIPAFEIVFIRLLFQTVLVLPPAIWNNVTLLGERKRRFYLVCFGVVNFFSISSIYGAFTKLPLGDATVCISATPIFTALLAFIFLKEAWHKVDALATFICLAGIVLITRPTFIFGGQGIVLYSFPTLWRLGNKWGVTNDYSRQFEWIFVNNAL